MRVKLFVKEALTLLLAATLIMTFIKSPVLARINLFDSSEDDLSTQNSGKDVTRFETLTEGEVEPNSAFRDEGNLNNANERSEFNDDDKCSTQLVIRVNNRISDAYTQLMGIIAKYDCEVVNTVSMAGEIIAVVVDVSSAEAPSLAREMRAGGLSSYIEHRMKFQAQFVPNDPYWSLQWGPQKIQADWAWNTTIGDTSVLVAVIDTGIDWDHPELAANYVALGYDWVNNDTDPMDDEGHGTHCAGIIAAVINNSIGVAGLAQVRIMAEKGLDQYGEGYEDDLANAVIHAVDQGADVLSLSWGGYGESALIYDAMRYAHDAGVLVVAAAGNEATSTKLYPAAYDEVIAVTATDQYDNPASFTNFGEWVELAAPGVNIYSTYWDNTYTSMSGTSMSTPHVAGVAALILSQFPNMARDSVRAQLRFTTDDLGDPGFDDYYGYGRINARRAVEQVPPDHDLLIMNWELPATVEPGDMAIINTTVLNFGTNDESDITVQLLVNGSIVDSVLISFLASGWSVTVNSLWNPAGEGVYNVTSYVMPVPDETITQNNLITEIVTVVGPPSEAFWMLLATDPDEGVGTSLKAIYGQLYSNIIYFKVEHYRPWTTINDIDTAIFIDADQDPSTGLPDGFYPGQNTGMGADYVIVVGWQATEMWKWDPITEMWDLGNPISFAYLDAPDGSNVFVVGVFVASVETAGILDCAVSDILSDWDWMPDAGYFSWFLIRYEHELTVFLEAPQHLQPSETSLLNVTVYNVGLNNETNVGIQLLINGTEVASETLDKLVNGAQYTLNYSWTPTIEGIYNITAYAPPVPDENITANNWYTKFVMVRYAVIMGMIETHGETLHSEDLVNYYTSLGHIVEKITTTITPGVLNNYDIVIVGEDWGDTPWLPSEIAAVEASIDSGKGFVAIGDELATSVQEILGMYGVSYTGISAPSGSSSNFDPLHPIMQGVSLIYAAAPVNSLQITAPAYWIANDISDTYILIAGAEVGGYVLCLSNDFAAHVYDGDNEVMFKNIVDWMTVKYEHELVVRLDAPSFLEPSGSSLLNVTVYNRGLSNETDVELFLLINGTIVNNVTIPELVNGTYDMIDYLWTPTVEATYNVTSYVEPMPGENITTNNFATKIITVRFAKYVLWDDVHDDDGDSLTGNYFSLYQLLSSSGFVVDELASGTINSEVLAPYDILVLIDPEYDFSLSEISDIHDWVASGGALIVIPDAGYPSTINTIMTPYGVQLTGLDTGYGTTTNIIAHPITQDVESIYYDRAWELAVSSPSETLAWTLEYYAFLSATTGGEVAVISDSNMMDNYGIGMADNMQLMLNMFNWIGVKYEHELSVSMEAPDFLEPGDSSLLNATVYNRGLNNETDVDLFLSINGTVVNSITIPELLTGGFYTINYLWTPVVEAAYNLTAYASPVPGENVTANNLKSVIVLVQVLPDILIVNDDDGSSLINGTSLPEFESVLTAAGYNYWVWNESSTGNPPLDFLRKFQLIIWTCGDYWDWAVDPTDSVTLESYLAEGGNILIEGEDIGYDHEADDFMVNVAHAIYQVDDTGAPGLTVTDPAHPVTFGLPNSFTWLTDPPYDDGVSPTNGGTEVIQYTGTTWTSVTIFEGASSGSVVYYAFPLYCLTQYHRETLTINSINWLLGVRYEHELAIVLEAPDFVEPSDSWLLNATVYNRGLSNETDVGLQLLVNGTEVDSIIIPELLSASLYTLSYLWTPTIEGTYNVTAYAPPVPCENITMNNVDSQYVIVSYAPKILAYVQFTDYDEEYANALGAIDSTFGPNYLLTELWDYAQLDSMLPGNRILFIPEQENADLYTMEIIGAAWSATLSNFMNEGGVIILCDHTWGFGGTYGILTGAELMSISGSYSITGSTVYLVDLSDPLGEGVSNTFIAPNGALIFITAESNVVFNDGTYPVVIHKTIGPGQIVLIGFDYLASNPDADQILGNAVGLWTPYEPLPPVANFTWTPSIPKVSESATFDASGSTPNGGTIVKYEWNFGDNGTTTGKTVTHTYVNPGTYTVTLNVTDSEGLWDIEQKQIQVVQPHGPKAGFITTPETAHTDENIKFNASASLPGWNGTHTMPITEYRWDFGDGNTTTTTTPIIYHSYETAGNYYVTLTAYAPGATPETHSATRLVTVISVPIGGYSLSISTHTIAKPLTLHIALIAILTVAFIVIRRKTPRKIR